MKSPHFYRGVLGRFFASFRMTETNSTLVPCVKERHVEAKPKYRMVGKLEKFTCLKEKSNSEGLVNSELTNQLDSFTIAQNDRGRHSELDSESINVDLNPSPVLQPPSPRRGEGKSVAFTLAEVLITLGIIGVVAAMIMPALIANNKKSEISAKLKKFNTTMSQCVLLSEQDNGPAEEWSSPGEYDTFDLDKFFKTYFAPYLKYSNTELKTDNGAKHYYVYLLDGGYFYFVKGNCVDIVYDVNGFKKPNAHGRDTFRFLLCGSKSPEWCDGRHFCPMYSTSAHTREEKIRDCIKGDRGSGCTGLLEYDGWEFKKDYPIRL